MLLVPSIGKVTKLAALIFIFIPILGPSPAQTVPQVSFVARRDYLVGQSPCCDVVGDFNGDGVADLAVANVQSGSISILLGNGNGTFRPAGDVLIPSPVGLTAADFNGDGRLDLAVITTASVSILPGNGNGTFQPAMNIALPLPMSAVVAADFDGDGRMDLAITVVTNPVTTAGGVAVLLGNGDGTFQAPATFAAGKQPIPIAVGDFNGDGKPDLIAGNFGDETVSLLLGNGDGTFKAALNLAVGAVPHGIAVADLNHDFKADLAVATVPAILAFLGNGDGTFQAPTSNRPDQELEFFSVGAGDFNGDGRLDLAATGNGNAAAVFVGNGDGTFGPPATFETQPDPQLVTVADLDNDGNADLVALSSFANSVSVLLGKADGTFLEESNNPPGGAGAVAGDFNQDGKTDLAIAGSQVAVLLGNGNGTFQSKVDYPAGTDPGSIATGDFNKDGVADLAVLNRTSADISILLGNSNGSFQAAKSYIAGSDPISMTFADFNGDGNTDVAVANGTADCRVGTPSIVVLSGKGDGTFSAGVANPVSCPLNAIAAGDFNGDGKTDMVAAMGNGLFFLPGNGDGSFQPGQNIVSGVANFLAAGDFNRDGKLDFAIADTDASTVSVFAGNGDGTFGSPASYPVGLNPNSLVAADVNGDSVPELVTANYNGDTVSVLIANDDGSFQPAAQFGTALHPVGTAVGDFNDDGKPDVAAVTAANVSLLLSGSRIAPKLGLGMAPGRLPTATVLAGGTATYWLTIGGTGFTGTATISCTGVPTDASCSVPATLDLSATLRSPLAVKVTTTPRSTSALHPLPALTPWLWAAGLFGIVLPLSSPGRRSMRRIPMMPMVLLLFFLCSCGGGSGPQPNANGTPAGNYTLTVKASSGSLNESIPLTLNVQ
jgi:hypothetical protein